MAYSKQTWVRGEKVASAKLNHMEDGIAAISANGAIDTANLANASVTNDKLDQEAVDSNNIRTGAIITPLIYDGAVTLPKLGADVIAELDNKADIDGSYEGMTVGNAEQLVSTVGVEDSAPYTFRTTGGSADVGDRMNLKAVVGGTVAWNQLLPSDTTISFSGLTITNPTVGTWRFNGTINSAVSGNLYMDLVANHVYYMRSGRSANDIVLSNTSNWTIKNEYIVKPTASGKHPNIYVAAGTYTNADFIPQMFDLTAMFGSAIADYVYTLETATAGAGIAWLKSYGFFTKPYYTYAAANLQSVKTSAHITYGFNAYDNSTGKAKVVGGMMYQITGAYTALSLDGTSITPDASGYFTPSANGELTVTGGNSTTTCIHLKWDGERDGEWEEFSEHTYALDDVELRGILKLDASNNLYADGDRYLPDGTVERRYGVVDLGTLTWVRNTQYANPVFLASIPLAKRPSTSSLLANAICAIYEQKAATYTNVSGVNKVFAIGKYYSSDYELNIIDTSYTDATAFKTAMSGVYLVYELATPTTETASPYQQTQIVDDFGTEEFVDAAVEANERDVAIPVGNETFYQNNLKAKLEMAPNSPDGGNGDYIVRQTNGTNEYVNISSNSTISGLSTRCPACPTDTDGNFVLKATVSGGSVTYSWVSA